MDETEASDCEEMNLTKNGSEFDPCSALLIYLEKLEQNGEHRDRPGSVNLNEKDGAGG